MNSADPIEVEGKEKQSAYAQGMTQAEQDPKYAFKATAFLASVAGMSALFGFGTTLAYAKKKDPTHFDKGVIMGPSGASLSEGGAALAVRALGWGTLYAVGGCGILFYSIWKLSGCNNLHEFRMKMGQALPKIRKNDPPQSRTEFEGLGDLMRYLETWGAEKKQAKATPNLTVETQSSSTAS